MSVVIKGFDKPASCLSCPFNHSDCWCEITRGEIDRDDYRCDLLCPIEPLDDNATNGDVIKTIFPNAYIEETTNSGIVFIDNGGGVTHFNKDWWNAQYERGEKNDR